MEKDIVEMEIVNFLEANLKKLERSVLKRGFQLERKNVHRPNFDIDIQSKTAIKDLCRSVEAYKESLMVLLKSAAKDEKKLKEMDEEGVPGEEYRVEYNDYYKEMLLKYEYTEEEMDCDMTEQVDGEYTEEEMDAEEMYGIQVYDQSEFVKTKIENGKVYMRSAVSWGRHPYYLQVADTKPILIIKKKCSICQTSLAYADEREFHRRHSHRGGERCKKCGFVAFTLRQSEEHNCKAPERRLETDKNDNVKVGFGAALFGTFALPLKRGEEYELWIGTTSCSSAVSGANTAISFVDAAAINNFKRKTGKSKADYTSIGFCASLAEKLYPKAGLKWTALPNEAFSFDTILRGTEAAADQTKFFIRAVIDAPCHHKPPGIFSVMQNVADTILESLVKDKRIPIRQMSYLKEHLEEFKIKIR